MYRDTYTFLKQLCYLFFLKRVSRVIPLIIFPLLVRKVGLEHLGIIKFVEAIASYLLILVKYGFRYSATQQIAQYRDDKRLVGQILGTVYSVKIVAIGLCWAIAGGLVFWVPQIQQLQAYFLTYLAAAVIGKLFPSFIFQGLDKMLWMASIRLLAKAVLLTGIVMLIRSPADARLYHVLLIVVDLLQLILALYVIHYVWGIRISMPTRSMVALQLRKGLPIFLSQLPITFYTKLPKIFLGFLVNASSVGSYLLGVKAVRLVLIMVEPFTRILFPLAHKHLARSFQEGARFISKITLGGLAILVVIGGCYWLFAASIVQLLAGKVVQDAVWILRLHAFLPCVVILSNILGMCILIPLGAGRVYTLITWTTGLFCVALNSVLVGPLQARGAAIVILLCEIFSMVMLIWATYRSATRLLAHKS